MTQQPSPDNRALLACVRAWAAHNYPGCPVEHISIHLRFLPVAITLADSPAAAPAVSPEASSSDEAAWEPNEYQCRILEALEFRALRSDALVNELGGDRRRLWKRGGIKELVERGLVALDKIKRLGYYRPDASPTELEGIDEAPEE